MTPRRRFSLMLFAVAVLMMGAWLTRHVSAQQAHVLSWEVGDAHQIDWQGSFLEEWVKKTPTLTVRKLRIERVCYLVFSNGTAMTAISTSCVAPVENVRVPK